METVLIIIIIVVSILLYTISKKIDDTNRNIINLHVKLNQLLKNYEKQPKVKEEISPAKEDVMPVKEDIKTQEKEKEPELKPEPEIIVPVPALTPDKEVIVEKVIAQPHEKIEDDKPTVEKVQPEVARIPFSEFPPHLTKKWDTPKKEKKKVNYEEYIGGNLFGKIGILILVIGIGFFVKYAIDKDWINEIMRTILGFACGIGLLIIAERLKTKYRTFSSLLAGGSFAIFYVTTAIAFHYYHLFSQPIAFGILIVITVLMSGLSILYGRRELAIISLIGGFIAPFLVSSGEGNYIVLFTYILILNFGMFWLSLYKKWAELPIISFVFTYGIMLMFTINTAWNQVFIEGTSSSLARNMLVFSTLFYLIFLLPILSILKTETPRTNKVLLLTIAFNNFIYLAFGLYFISEMKFSFKAEGALPLFIAMVNAILVFWLKKQKQDYKLLIHTMLGMVITFISISIPIQMEGRFITLLWASEMVLLLWLFVRSKIRLYEYFSLALIILTLLSFASTMFAHNYWSGDYKNMLITNLYTGIAFLASMFLMIRHKTVFQQTPVLTYRPWSRIMLIFAAGIIYYSFADEISYRISNSYTSIKALLLYTSAYILMFTIVLRKYVPINKFKQLYKSALFINTLLFIIDSYLVGIKRAYSSHTLLSWSLVIITVLTFISIGRQYYLTNSKNAPSTRRFTIYFTILATLCWLSIENLLLEQFTMKDEYSAGFSIALSIAAFIQMGLGMKLHMRPLRMISLAMFGIVLAKLIVIDLWAMPTIGKIIVFIILGIILLVLSFLYQKLKDVLFKDDRTEE